MQKRSNDNKNGWWLLIGLLLIAFYMAFAVLDGPHRYADSSSYISMSISREPMYGLFLGLFRMTFGRWGEDVWLYAAVMAQSLIAALSALYFTKTLSRLFSLSRLADLGLALCTVLPSLMCRFVANRRMMYSCSILSEALAMPLFLVFFACLLRCAILGGMKAGWEAAFWSFVLISIRKQMYICLPLLVLTLLWRGIREKKFLPRLIGAALLSAVVLLSNSLLDRGYNYLLRGEAIRHTGDARFVTTMLLYNTHPGDEEAIADEELRDLYKEIYIKADSRQFLGIYAPEDWFGRVSHFSGNYDHIQFDCLRDTARVYAKAKYGDDETAVNLEMDRINTGLNAALLLPEAPRLLRTVADSFASGLLTTVLSMNRRFVPVAGLLYVVFLALVIRGIGKKRESLTILGLLTLPAIAANVGLVSLTIFCQARYTIYNMPIFYATLFLLLCDALLNRRKHTA